MLAKNFYKRKWLNDNECDVLIVVEHTVRELESAMLIKKRLEEQNIKVIIDSPKWNINRLPILYKPKCVLVPWVYSEKEFDVWKHFKNQFGERSVIINLHHEQITGQNNIKWILPNNESSKVYHLCWGKDYYNSIDKLVPKNSRLLFGSVRLELIKSNGYDKNILFKQYGLNPKKKTILFLANSFHLQTDSEVSFFESNGLKLKDLSESGKNNTRDALLAFRSLMKEEEDCQIIYRPHPSMIDREKNHGLLQDIAQEFPDNFKVIGDFSLHHWIKVVNLVVTFHSTGFTTLIQ